MKHSFLLVLSAILLTANNLNAQDIITKRDSSKVDAIVLEITQDEIKYKKASNSSGPTYILPISDVVSIRYSNGDKDTFSPTQAKPIAEPQTDTLSINQEDTLEVEYVATIDSTAITLTGRFDPYINDYNPFDVKKDKVANLTFDNSNITAFCNKTEIVIPRNQVLDLSFISKNTVKEKKKSVGGRAVLWGVLFGPVGAIAGGISGIGNKSVVENGVYLTIEFKDDYSRENRMLVFTFDATQEDQVREVVSNK